MSIETTAFDLWRRRWYWLISPRLMWVSVAFATLTVAALVCRAPWPAERTIRLWGLFLQCAGMAAVLFDLVGRGKAFAAPHPWVSFTVWLRRWPRDADAGSLHFAVEAGLKASANVEAGPTPFAPSASVDEKFAVVAENIEALHERVDASRRKSRADIDALSTVVRDFKTKTESDQAQASALLKETMAGGLGPAWFGLAWLFVGAVVSTAAPELAGLLH